LTLEDKAEKIEEKVEKHLKQVREDAETGVNLGIKTGEHILKNMSGFLAGLMQTLKDNEFKVTLSFNKLTLDGSISKTISLNKKK
jgi:hypothetical protein